MTADLQSPEIICISDDDDDVVVAAKGGGDVSQPESEFPKRLGSFQTRGVITTSLSSRFVTTGAQLIFPLKQKKEAPKIKKRKVFADDGTIRFLVLESAEPYKGRYPPPLGHFDRNRLEIGKLDIAISKILLPLLSNHYIAISAVIRHAPAKISLSSSLDIELHVFVLPKLFMSSGTVVDDVSGEMQYDPEAHIRSQFFNLLQLLEGVSIENVYKYSQREAERAKFRLEALYESIDVEHQQLPEAEAPSRLKCTLRPYQKQALYWLLCREKSIEEKASVNDNKIDPEWSRHRFPDREEYFYSNRSTLAFSLDVPYVKPKSCGGILGDEMGMGKTVEMIALMASQSPEFVVDDEVDYIKATLVVCPMSLLSQWECEVQRHSDLRVETYYGNDRDLDSRDFDVLITTYGTLQSEFKNAESSLLFKATWDRIVLDEAHSIKNKTTQTAKAAFALNARARFTVTGTPIQNNLGDLFSLFHFLREEPWSKYSWWRSQIEVPYERNNPIALQRLKAILHPLFLRRCKTSKDVNGKPLLDLPPRDEQLVHITLSEEERALYDTFFNQTRTEVNGLLESGTLFKNTTNVLEMILRLRQCCCHPLLVLGYTPDGGAKQYADAVTRLLRSLKSKVNNDEDGSECKLSQTYIENLSQELKSGESANDLECPICIEDVVDPVFTHCGHVMCRECSTVLFAKKRLVSCPICRNPIKKHQLLNGFSTKATEIDLNKQWRHSSKTKRLLSEIAELHSADAESKTVVFSQWASMLDLVEKALSEDDHRYLRLDGSLTQRAREKVLNQFTSPDSEYRILLCSLKVGGVGLNLVAASNVILLDIWWNPAIDAQAIDRVHRIGQTKTVKIRRFVVSQSIETRILELQNKKIALAHGAIQSSERYDDLTARQQDFVHLFEGFN